MASVIIEVTGTPRTLPPGVTFHGYRYEVTDDRPNALQFVKDDAELSTRVDDLPEGVYAVSVWALVNPVKPEKFGEPATGQLTVGAPGSPPETYMAPTGLAFLVV